MMSAIGRYEVRRELGRGAMGIVYEAFDPELARLVALKTLSLTLAVPDEERRSFEQRFLNEAKAAAGLSHPNIVIVYDVGRDPATGVPFMALEYLHGKTLAETPLPMPWREAFRLATRVATALQAAHERGIVHRDVKPANIMVLPSGEPKVMDFGIAKLPSSQLTVAGQVFGTPSNMSPEQALGEPLDARSDLFSLGTVLYQLLTGSRAFEGPDLRAILGQVVHQQAPPPSQLVPGLPAGTDEVLARALAKSPDQRYQDGRSFAEDLDDLLGGRQPRHCFVAVPGVGESPLADLIEEAGPPRRDQTAATLRTPAAVVSPVPRSPAASGVRPALVAVGALLLLLAVGAAALLGRRATLGAPAAAPSVGASLGEPPPSTAGAAEEAPRLVIDFAHPLRAGTLQVWVDDDLALDRDFRGGTSRELGPIKLRKGRMDDEIGVAPGRHRVRVRVSWDSSARTESISGTFAPGAEKRLEIRIGWLRKDLSLAWR